MSRNFKQDCLPAGKPGFVVCLRQAPRNDKAVELSRQLILFVLIWLVEFYQRYISGGFGSSCRYHPSCSGYFLAALKRYGIFRGIARGILRILRCNPFFVGGYDPLN